MGAHHDRLSSFWNETLSPIGISKVESRSRNFVSDHLDTGLGVDLNSHSSKRLDVLLLRTNHYKKKITSATSTDIAPIAKEKTLRIIGRKRLASTNSAGP